MTQLTKGKSGPHKRDVVVIGASSGGIAALLELVKSLPHDFPAPFSWCSTWRPTRPACWPGF